MVKPVQQRRLVAMALLLCVALGGLGYRLIDLQVLRHEDLRVRGERHRHLEFVREPMRGQIRDARGNLLATSAPAKVVCADPGFIGEHYPAVARALAPLLQVPEERLAERLQPGLHEDGRPRRYVVLQRKVPLDVWDQIREIMADLPLPIEEQALTPEERRFLTNLRRRSVFSEDDRLRVYPNERLAAHVLGHVNHEGRGVNGIEQIFDAKLRGVSGWRQTERDRRGREMVRFRVQDVEPQNGMTVVLTIDAGLQHILEAELEEAFRSHEPISVTGIIVRPRTGEILGMATVPNFDPGNPGASGADTWRNRAITDVAEPGSTFKIVVVAAALHERVVRLDDVIDCENGRFYFAGRPLHDVGSHGMLSVKNVITKSSNIGTAKIGIQMGEPMLYQYVREFGFGARTGIPLPGEVGGIVNRRDWTRISVAQVPMGHGVAVTPLQMAMAMSAIANDGRLMRPMLVKRIDAPDGNTVVDLQPQTVRQVVSEMAARQLVEALKNAIGPDGTGHRARLDHYTVAGKTGTAQKAGRGGYMRGKYHSSFIGFFPADAPELCIAIFLDEPKNGFYGGQVAAPVFKRVAERSSRYLNIKPEHLPGMDGRMAVAAP